MVRHALLAMTAAGRRLEPSTQNKSVGGFSPDMQRVPMPTNVGTETTDLRDGFINRLP